VPGGPVVGAGEGCARGAPHCAPRDTLDLTLVPPQVVSSRSKNER
jgi:hypothetical protein